MLKIYPNNVKEYRNLIGQLHREDGAAIEWPNGDKYWFIKGLYHRIAGPAFEHGDIKRWYLNGRLYIETI